MSMNLERVVVDLWDVVLAMFMAILLMGFSYRLWKHAVENEASGWRNLSVNFLLTGIFFMIGEIVVVIKYIALYSNMEDVSLALGALSTILWLASAYYASRGILEYLEMQREVLG